MLWYAAFNRTGATGVSGTAPSWSQTLSGNTNNQVTNLAFTQNGATSNTGYTYDGEGNRASLTSGNTVTTYAYDAQQRLTQVSQSVNGAAATVTMKAGYASDGLRAWKENSQGVRTYFLYDGDQLVAEFDSSGVMQASQTWGVEGLSYRRTASGASAGNRFYSWDVRGNIAATTDSTGAVVNTPSSDGFSSSGGSEPCATFGGQVGGYKDVETGLILFGQRYYDPSLGSWLTRDPIAENGGINLYSYVQGNPVGWVDPDGFKKKKVAYIMTGEFPMSTWGFRHYAGNAENEIAEAKRYFYGRGYDKIYVVRGATRDKFRKALRRSNTKGLWYYGHAWTNNHNIDTVGGIGSSVSEPDVKKWLHGRKLDDAIFHSCYVGSDQMKKDIVGDKGTFWGTEQSYVPDSPWGTLPNWITERFEKQKRKK